MFTLPSASVRTLDLATAEAGLHRPMATPDHRLDFGVTSQCSLDRLMDATDPKVDREWPRCTASVEQAFILDRSQAVLETVPQLSTVAR